MKTLTNNGWIKRELAVVNELYQLGLISEIERESKIIRIKYIHKTQSNESK